MGDESHADDLAGGLLGLVGRMGKLYAAAFAAASGVDLRLDDDRAAEFFGDLARLGGRLGDSAVRDGNAEFLEDFLRLIFMDFHVTASH